MIALKDVVSKMKIGTLLIIEKLLKDKEPRQQLKVDDD